MFSVGLAQPARSQSNAGPTADWKARLRAAGYAAKPDGSYVWDDGRLNLLLIPGSSGREPTRFSVTVGPQTKSSREHLDLKTPEMVRAAVEALRGARASLAFEYIGQVEGVKPAALRDAMIHWAETVSWSAIDEQSGPQPLKGFEGWLIVGARIYRVGTFVMIGIVRPRR